MVTGGADMYVTIDELLLLLLLLDEVTADVLDVLDDMLVVAMLVDMLELALTDVPPLTHAIVWMYTCEHCAPVDWS